MSSKPQYRLELEYGYIFHQYSFGETGEGLPSIIAKLKGRSLANEERVE